ncbi:MAG TPA: alpha/beta fold hydrolase [Pedococcus sp.]|nr:alpha/beta fold hydrolase [Pedococcus sp.]
MNQFSRQGLVFDLVDSGPAEAEAVVVLLHGWPQDHTAWDRVTPLLVAGGLRVLALDQRGYSPGARPPGTAAYRMRELVADVAALLDEAGAARAHLVGHDWGGAVAWAFAERHPERLDSLTVLSTPHHRALAWAFRHGDQARRSWYMAAFQVPAVPEAVLRRTLPHVLRRSGLPEPDAERYAARFRQPGAARAQLAWYRALRNPLRGNGSTDRGSNGKPRRITVPTTYVWGRHDPVLGRAAAERTGRYVVSDYQFVELDAGHWLPETRPDDVATAVLSRAGGVS